MTSRYWGGNADRVSYGLVPERLVEDEDVLVLIEDHRLDAVAVGLGEPQGRRRRGRCGFLAFLHDARHAHLGAGSEPRIGLHALRVDADLAGAPGKAAATVEGEARLADWIAFCLTMVKSGGTVTLIHRPDRLPELLRGLTGRTGGITVFPIWPRDPGLGDGLLAKRVIVQARIGSNAPGMLVPAESIVTLKLRTVEP